jgi:hypothetical protein
MLKLSKKLNIIIKIEDLPKSILGIYIKVNETPYILINEILHGDMHDFMVYACCYFHNKDITGKITFNDLENTNFEPFHYARKKLKKNVC